MPLPSSLDYRERYESLPKEASKHTVSLSARNGNSFIDGGEEIIFDFHQTGYLVPDSLYFRFQIDVVNGATATSGLGSAFYGPFVKLETIIDDNTVDSINNYNQVQTVLLNLNMNVAQKYGNLFNLGFSTGTSIENVDQYATSQNTTSTYNVAGPIQCLLSNCDKLIPLWAMPKIRMIFTTDNIINIFASSATISGITISNPELCYDCIQLGEEYDKKIKSLGKVFIESQSFSNKSTFLRSAGNGYRNIVFNESLSHVKCAFVLFSPISTVNRKFEAVDITNNSGGYSMTIGQYQYPQVELSTNNNKGGFLMEIQKCANVVFGNKNLSINSLEFNITDNGSSTSAAVPGKFYIPFLFEYVNMKGQRVGLSVKNENIVVNVNQSIAQSANRICYLISVYKATLEIDLKNRLAKVLN